MKDLKVVLYIHSSDLPPMECRNYFHSKAYFELCEQASRMKPYMATVQTADGTVVAHMIAVVRRRSSWLPPYLYRHCRIHGDGDYTDCDYKRDELFGLMLKGLSRTIIGRAFYTEFSNLSQKMFGYRQFRQNGFFPVRWMSIHNSLHSKAPEERLNEKMVRRIEQAMRKGVTTAIVESDSDFKEFSKLLRHHHLLKPKRYIPGDTFFRLLQQSGNGQLFVTRYKGHVVGCCACAFSGGNAYLWYSAFRRKSFAAVHPDVMTIWGAIQYAYRQHYEHIVFMDVGLPFRRNPFREFILRFGGKPVRTYRWFHCSINWLNRLLSWIYRE